MTDHGGVEKTGPLRTPLSLDGQPSGADPGIVILGKLEGDAAQRIAELAGRVTVTVEAK